MAQLDFEQQYDTAIETALRVVRDLEGRYNATVAEFNNVPAQTGGSFNPVTGLPNPSDPRVDNPAYIETSRRLQDLGRQLGEARIQLSDLYTKKANALEKLVQAPERALTPQEKAKLEADTVLAKAQADNLARQGPVDTANIALLTARTDSERASAKAALMNAEGYLNNSHAALSNAQSEAIKAGAAVISAQATATRAGIDVQKAPSEISLTSAQAGQATAQSQLIEEQITNLKRQREATSDAAVQRNIDLELQKKEADLAEIRARVTASDVGISRTQLGPLYGFEQKVAEIDRLVRQGVIKDKDSAIAALQERLAADVAGTTPYDAFTADRAAQEGSQSRAITQRSQDVGLVGTRTNTFGSFAGSALGNMIEGNKTAAIGSDAYAQAYASLVANILQAFGGPQGLQTPARINTDVPSFAQRTPLQMPAQPAPAPAPVQTASQPQQPTPEPQAPQPEPFSPAPAETSAESQARNAVPTSFQGLGPVTEEDIQRRRAATQAIINGTHRGAAAAVGAR